MKYFRFIGDSKHVPFKEGEIYKGSFEAEGWAKVSRLAKLNPCDWERVKTPKKTLFEKIEKLKKHAEREGLKCEVVLSNPTFTATNNDDERVKERVRVDWVETSQNLKWKNAEISFAFNKKVQLEGDKVGEFLASKLEEYLNDESK